MEDPFDGGYGVLDVFTHPTKKFAIFVTIWSYVELIDYE